jgi:hypothetical protein
MKARKNAARLFFVLCAGVTFLFSSCDEIIGVKGGTLVIKPKATDSNAVYEVYVYYGYSGDPLDVYSLHGGHIKFVTVDLDGVYIVWSRLASHSGAWSKYTVVVTAGRIVTIELSVL